MNVHTEQLCELFEQNEMRLLIIEDEADLRKALVMGLTDEGYAIDSAEDGEEGLYKALNWDYDAVVLDIMLPVMDGWEVLQQLRKEKSTPVLILTARDSLDDCIKGLDLGSDDFMVKPFEMPELLARLRALIRRAAHLSSNRLSCGEIELDLARKRVTLNGDTVVLTPVEYSLIEYMISHKNQVVSRSELYEHLFDENADSLSNHLDVHVCNIRKKLGSHVIWTRRGQGYVMEDGSAK